jgi:ATP-dependent DNA helicase Q1
MVFTEQTGLSNLYSIVNYCIDMKSCKRNLIAEHFNDFRWTKTGKCNEMCIICKNGKQTIAVNCIEQANIVLKILDKHATKEKQNRLTANKLSELATTEITKSSKNSEFKLNQTEIEYMILTMLMNQHLREDFHFTPYNTICYLIKGNVNLPKSSFEIPFLNKNPNVTTHVKSKTKTISKVKTTKEIKYISSDDDQDILVLNSDEETKTIKKIKVDYEQIID